MITDECKEFISGLIDAVSAHTGDPALNNDITKVLSAIQNPDTGRGIQLILDYKNPTNNAPGAALGSQHDNSAQIVIAFVQVNVTGYTPGQIAFEVSRTQYYYASVVLHEAIHLSAARGAYNDFELVETLYKRGDISETAFKSVGRSNSDGSASSCVVTVQRHPSRLSQARFDEKGLRSTGCHSSTV